MSEPLTRNERENLLMGMSQPWSKSEYHPVIIRYERTVRELEATVESMRQVLQVVIADDEGDLNLALADIEKKSAELLWPCDRLRFQLLADPDDSSQITFLVLVPVSHPLRESARRMEKFEDWWFERKRQLSTRVVVDLDHRLTTDKP